jgi:hypothetical protein
MTSLAKIHSVLEKFWWAMTIVTLLLIIIFIFQDGWNKWWMYLAVPLLTALMALMRRLLRKKLEKSEAIRDQRMAENQKK